MLRFGWLGVCLAVMSVVGCGGGTSGPEYAGVDGVVLLDGKAMEGAVVTFSPKEEGTMSMGMTDAEGKFTLKTATGKNGAAVGDHDVSITLKMELGGTPPAATDDGLAPLQPNEAADQAPVVAKPPTTKWIIPERYSDPKNSGLGVTVPSGGLSDHKFELTSK